MKRSLPDGFRIRGTAVVRDFVYRGKRIRVTVGTSTDIAAALANAPQVEAAERVRVDALHEVIFADLAERWLKARVQARRNEAGQKLAKQRVEDHIAPVLGELIASAIGEEDLWKLRNTLDTKKLAPMTVFHILSEVRGILRFGERVKDASGRRVIPPGENPWTPDVLPTIERQSPKGLSDAQVDKLIEACTNSDQEFVVRILVLTGLRWSELRKVEWGHFSPDNEPFPRLLIERTKTKRFRLLPLVPEAVSLLEARRREVAAIAGPISPYVTVNGANLFGRLSARAGFHAHPHQLRHTWGDRMLRAGLGLLAIQGGFGHTTVRTTERYLPEAFAVLADALRGVPAERLRSCTKYGRSQIHGAGR